MDDATLLSYTTPPDAADPSAKNFLFFAAQGALYAIALIEPHVVYSLHPLRGHDHVANMAPAHVTHTTFGFGHHLRLSLSGGPVRADERTFLVAAHVAVGGWWNAMRLTFFYAFDAEHGKITNHSETMVTIGVSSPKEFLCFLLRWSGD